MKRISVIMLLLMIALTMFTACGNEPKQSEEVTIVGQLNCSNYTEDELAEVMQKAGFNNKVIFYDDLNTMLLALEAGEIDRIHGIPEAVADYIVTRNQEISKKVESGDVVVSYQMAVKKENAELLASLNEAIDELYDNGTMEQLIEDYINAYITTTDEPIAVDIPAIKGADTVRIAVTGDIPPMDLVTADGKAAGFNIALLAEMSKIMNVNFELVPMDTAARTLSIASDKVDAIFWIMEPSNNPGIDLPDTLTATESYFSGARCNLSMAK